MKINVSLPFDRIEYPDEFLRADAIAEVARAAERVGFDAGCDTDHPVPTGRWLDAGGHHAQDPFVILSLVAAATRTLRLQTGILVLPYRNPFIVARAVATLDFVSAGRVTLGVGAGYLKGEYKALGIDFERRNEIMDEYLHAMKAAWTADEFTFRGHGLPGARQPHSAASRSEAASAALDRRQFEARHSPRRRARRWLESLHHLGGRVIDDPDRRHDGRHDLAGGDCLPAEHCEKIGRSQPPEVVLGALPYRLRPAHSPWAVANVTVERTGRNEHSLLTQHFFELEGEAKDLQPRFTLADLSKPDLGLSKPGANPPTLYPPHHYDTYEWAMTIDNYPWSASR